MEDDAQGPDNEDVEIVDLDARQGEQPLVKRTALTSHVSLQQRRIQLLTTVALCVLALGMVLGVYAPTRVALVRSLLPSVAATIPPGTDFFYIQANPPWGKLHIDGTLVAHLPTMGVDNPLHLERGVHVLSWVAAPFPAQRCVVSVPPDYLHDTCYSDEIVAAPHGNARFLRFLASLGALPDTQSQALVNVVTAMLASQASTTVMEPGTVYALSIGPTGVAQQSLKAALHFKLDTNIHSGMNCSAYFGPNDGCIYNHQDCRTFCSASDLVSPTVTQPNAWIVLAVVYSVWDYTTLAGAPVSSNQPDIVNGNANEHFLPLKITWDGTQWHAQMYSTGLSAELQASFNPVCNDAQEYLTIEPWLSYVVSEQVGTNWSYVGSNNWTDGCLAIVKLDASSIITPVTHTPVAWCLHRFGVLLAANDTAHKFWPDMPVASEDEKRIAQQLASTA